MVDHFLPGTARLRQSIEEHLLSRYAGEGTRFLRGPVRADYVARLAADLRIAHAKVAISVPARDLDDVRQACTAYGIGIRWALPYGALCFDQAENAWMTRMCCRPLAFRRLLTWMEEDAHFAAFGTFLETTLAAVVPAGSLARNLVVLVAAPSGTEQPAPPDPAALGERLGAFLQYPRNRVLLYFLWSALWSNQVLAAELLSYLPDPHGTVLLDWRRRWEIDRDTLAWVRGWYCLPEVAEVLTCRGVPLGPGLEYELTADLLARYYRLF